MSQFLFRLEGVRGRSIAIYDRKAVITTKASVGSFITGNVSDGEKTIFYTDVVGVQFKKSGGLIGYLQLETGSVQMNNQNSNMFSENTFTFEHNKNGVTNEQMERVYHQLCDMIEQIKYGTAQTALPAAAPAPAAEAAPAAKTPEAVPAFAPAPTPAPLPTATPKFCTGCGKPVTGTSAFCTSCGTKLN